MVGLRVFIQGVEEQEGVDGVGDGLDAGQGIGVQPHQFGPMPFAERFFQIEALEPDEQRGLALTGITQDEEDARPIFVGDIARAIVAKPLEGRFFGDPAPRVGIEVRRIKILKVGLDIEPGQYLGIEAKLLLVAWSGGMPGSGRT